MEAIGQLWNLVFLDPMINGLLLLYSILFHNFGLAVIVFTVLVRILMTPLTLKQLRVTKAMSALQPRLKEIQTKYAKERQKISQETMKLYKQAGVSPLGCLGPMVIQFPIWIGLYQSIIQLLNRAPEGLVDLSRHLYSWLPWVSGAIPLDSRFLWLDLGRPDPLPVLPALVGISMWVQQKMSTLPTADPTQQSTNNMMLWMMPLMFMFFTFSFPSGLALYWVVSNIIGIAVQYFVTGWGTLWKLSSAPTSVPAATAVDKASPPVKERISDGKRGNHRQDSRRSRRDRPQGTER